MNLENEGIIGLKIKRPVPEPKESWIKQPTPQLLSIKSTLFEHENRKKMKRERRLTPNF